MNQHAPKVASKLPKHQQSTSLTGIRGYEQKVKVADIVKLVVPALTRDIVRIQKNLKSTVRGDGLMADKGVQLGRFVQKSKKYTEKQLVEIAKKTTEYPFTILFKETELNIVAT